MDHPPSPSEHPSLRAVRETAVSKRFGCALVAHRGIHDGEKVAENSLDALELCVQAGIAAEIDLFFFDSLEVMIYHGPISRAKAQEVMRGRPPAGLCTIEDALALVGGRIPLFLELKYLDDARPEVVERSLGVIRAYDGPAMVMSFEPQVIGFKAKLPGIPVGLVTLGKVPEPAKSADFFLLCKSFQGLSRKRLPAQSTIGIWTYPNLKTAVRRLIGTSDIGIVNIKPSEI